MPNPFHRKEKEPKKVNYVCFEHDAVKAKLARIEGELVVVLIFLGIILVRTLA